MFYDDTPPTAKNKLGIYPPTFGAYPRDPGNKKAAPLGAAVIATLNHITGLTLHDPFFDGMG